MRAWAFAACVAAWSLAGGGALAITANPSATDQSPSETLAAERAQLRNGAAHALNNEWQAAKDDFQSALANRAFSSLTLGERFSARASLGFADAQLGDLAGARQAFQAAVESPDFSSLTAKERYSGRAGLGLIDYQLDDYVAALPYLKQASETEWADDELWNARFVSSFETKDFQDAAASLTTIAQRWPVTLAQTKDSAITHLERTARGFADGFGRDRALLEALYAAKWRPSDPFDGPDWIWMQLVRLRLEKGDKAGATAVAADISNPSTLAQMRIDKRFDSVVAAIPIHFDLVRESVAYVADFRKRSEAAPDKLEGINSVALLLDGQGKAADAPLSLLDDAASRAHPTENAESKFSDYADQINWTENNRAMVLADMGRFDEALKQYEYAARRPENGGLNVSQAINLADNYYAMQRPRDALDAVSEFDINQASAYGRMALQEARACAYSQMSDATNLKKALQYMSSHSADAPRVFVKALLCTDDLDTAAKTFIAQLDDPETRSDALYQIQDFLEPAHVMPFDAEMMRRWDDLRSRSDVRSTIEKYGRIESIPFER